MNKSLEMDLQRKILDKLKARSPDYTTEDDYFELLALFDNQNDFHTYLINLESRGLITSGLSEAYVGYECDIADLRIVNSK
jgi:hypothetical protein